MRITVDVDDKTIAEIKKITGIRKKSPAVGKALSDYCRSERKRRFLAKALAGETDYEMSNERLEAMGDYDRH